MSPLFGPAGRSVAARAPAPKNGVAKPGPRAETPQPTTARTRTLARKRAHLFDSNFDDAQTERGNSSGPDLRGDWGVETEAGAYERPLDGLQPRATLAACRTQVSVFVRADNSITRGDDRRIMVVVPDGSMLFDRDAGPHAPESDGMSQHASGSRHGSVRAGFRSILIRRKVCEAAPAVRKIDNCNNLLCRLSPMLSTAMRWGDPRGRAVPGRRNGCVK